MAQGRQRRHGADDGIAGGDQSGEPGGEVDPRRSERRDLRGIPRASLHQRLRLEPPAGDPGDRRHERPQRSRQRGDPQQAGHARNRPRATEQCPHMATAIGGEDGEMQPGGFGSDRRIERHERRAGRDEPCDRLRDAADHGR